jgi:hypothetical protein
MTIRVLTDLHHHALAESLLMLFEDRFGWELWFPQGMDWFVADIWQFEKKFHGDAVAKQFLMGWWDGSRHLGEVKLRDDPRHPWRTQKGISLNAAKRMKWDLVLSSLPHNDPGFSKFARKTGARFGVQVGNNLQDSLWDEAEYILSSSTLPGLGLESIAKRSTYKGVPTVVYHQEFDTEKVFYHDYPPANRREVASWVNGFPESPDYPLFTALARQYADEFDFKVYGAYGWGADDEFKSGDVSIVTDVADRMRQARTGLHIKRLSDGFGHTIHNWFAIGRPVMGFQDYYADKIAGLLFEEGVTSFAIENRTFDETAAILRRLRDDDDYHQRISENAAARFRAIVDFGAEADAIKAMLEDVLS